MTSHTALIIPFLSADHAIEIRKLELPDGKRRSESHMNDGSMRIVIIWRTPDGETQFDAHQSTPGGCAQWLNSDDAYTSIQRRDPETGLWNLIR